jgi:hypothetical protein
MNEKINIHLAEATSLDQAFAVVKYLVYWDYLPF